MIDLTGFWNELTAGLKTIVNTTLTDVDTEAMKLGERLFTKAKEDIEKWMIQFAAGAMTPDEFNSLLEGQKDWFEMESLRIKGLAKARADKFFDDITILIISSAAKMLL